MGSRGRFWGVGLVLLMGIASAVAMMMMWSILLIMLQCSCVLSNHWHYVHDPVIDVNRRHDLFRKRSMSFLNDITVVDISAHRCDKSVTRPESHGRNSTPTNSLSMSQYPQDLSLSSIHSSGSIGVSISLNCIADLSRG